jgi:hypothetical protein
MKGRRIHHLRFLALRAEVGPVASASFGAASKNLEIFTTISGDI